MWAIPRSSTNTAPPIKARPLAVLPGINTDSEGSHSNAKDPIKLLDCTKPTQVPARCFGPLRTAHAIARGSAEMTRPRKITTGIAAAAPITRGPSTQAETARHASAVITRRSENGLALSAMSAAAGAPIIVAIQ